MAAVQKGSLLSEVVYKIGEKGSSGLICTGNIKRNFHGPPNAWGGFSKDKPNSMNREGTLRHRAALDHSTALTLFMRLLVHGDV